MITLRKLAYEFRKLDAGGDPGPDYPITEAYAVLLARQCLNTLLKPLFYENYNMDDRGSLPLMLVPYEVTVNIDDVDHQYIDIPEFFIHLPYNKGLHGIAPIEEPTQFFIPRNSPSVSYNLPCADVEGQNSYYQVGKKIYFDKEVDLMKVLLFLLVAAPDSIGVDDSLPIYPEQQQPLLMLMRATAQNRPILDKIIDGNPDIQTKVAK